MGTLTERNAQAQACVAGFRAERAGRPPVIDQHFHKHKNAHPFFGFIPVRAAGQSFDMFSANDDLIAMSYFWLGETAFEPTSLDIWMEAAKEADVVLDIGAFSGIYALTAALANPACHVHAFEPARRTYARLLINIQTNLLTRRITPHNVALSDTEGTATFHQFRGEQVLGNGGSLELKDNLDTTGPGETVHLTRLDTMIEALDVSPDLIKIDVEGHELSLLAGAEAVLSSHRPRVLLEVTPRTYAEAVTFFERLGYRIEVVDDVGQRRFVPGPGQGIQRVQNIWLTP